MGSVHAKAIEPEFEYKYDPLEGFSSGRKPREIKTTLQEMEAARIPLDKRDYCVDYLMEFMKCRNQEWPLVYKCHHEKHEYLHCQYEDYLIRMKEYERNRRLDDRAANKAKTTE